MKIYRSEQSSPLDGIDLEDPIAHFVSASSMRDALRHKFFVRSDFPEVLAEWIGEDGEIADKVTFTELYERGFSLAVKLLKDGVKEKQPVLICMEPGAEFVQCVIGVWLVGGIIVPVYPPAPGRVSIFYKIAEKLYVHSCGKEGSVHVLTSARYDRYRKLQRIRTAVRAKKLHGEADKWPDFCKWDVVSQKVHVKHRNVDVIDVPSVCRDDIALLQFTSGSTSDPKGVMVTHSNLLFHLLDLHENTTHRCPVSEMVKAPRAAVQWVPPYHDLGLIAGIFQSFLDFSVQKCITMSPLTFIRNPELWIKYMHIAGKSMRVRSAAPNFAYELIARKLPATSAAKYNLKPLEFTASAAEPIRPGTMKRFEEAMKTTGFSLQQFTTAYGLAENTMMVTMGFPGDFRVIHVDGRLLEVEGRIEEVDAAHENARSFHSCGHARIPLKHPHYIRIVDTNTLSPCAQRKVGEVWVHSPLNAQGYLGQPELSELTFRAKLQTNNNSDGSHSPDDLQCLRTGDLGFVYDDYLYISGRLKDVIIINGRNYYPQDIELEIERGEIKRVRPGCCIVIAVRAVDTTSHEESDEKLVVVAEVQKKYQGEEEIASLEESIRRIVLENFEQVPAAVALIRERTIPKTSSGKVRRQPTKQLYTEKKLSVLNKERAYLFGSMEKAEVRISAERLGELKQIAQDHSESLQASAATVDGNPTEDELSDLISHTRQLLAALTEIHSEGLLIMDVVAANTATTSLADAGLDSVAITSFISDCSQLLNIKSMTISTVQEAKSIDALAELCVREVLSPIPEVRDIVELLQRCSADDRASATYEKSNEEVHKLVSHEVLALASGPRIDPNAPLSSLWEESESEQMIMLLDDALLRHFGDEVMAVVKAQQSLDKFTAPAVSDAIHSAMVDSFCISKPSVVQSPTSPKSRFKNKVAPVSPSSECRQLGFKERMRHFGCGVVQLLSLLVLPAYFMICAYPSYRMMEALTEYFRGMYAIGFFAVSFSADIGGREAAWYIAVYLPIAYILFGISLIMGTILLKWILLGRIREQRFRLWGWYFLRWWLLSTWLRIVEFVVLDMISGTIWINLVYRALGCKVALSASLKSTRIREFDLVSIGENSTVQGRIMTHSIGRDGWVQLGPVAVGSEVSVKALSVIMHHTELQHGSTLEKSSALLSHCRMLPGQHWAGVPAEPQTGETKSSKEVNVDDVSIAFSGVEAVRNKEGVRVAQEIGKTIGLIVLAYLFVLPGVPAFLLVSHAVENQWLGTFRYRTIVLSMLGHVLHMTSLTVLTILFKKCVVGTFESGKSYSKRHIRMAFKWQFEKLFTLTSKFWLSYFGKTLLPRIVLGALGAKLGKRVLINEVTATTDYEQLVTGNDVFISSSFTSGTRTDPRDATRKLYGDVKLESNVWIGVGASLESGTIVKDGAAAGALSYVPNDTTVCGGVASGVPAQISTFQSTFKGDFKQNETPSTFGYWVVGLLYTALSMCHVGIVGLLMLLVGQEYIVWVSEYCESSNAGDLACMILLSGSYFCAFWAVFLYRGCMERTVMSFMRPSTFPVGSFRGLCYTFIQFSIDLMTGYLFMDIFLPGSALSPWYHRLRGAKIGKCCYIASIGNFLDCKLWEVGDFVAIDEQSLLLGHSSNGRVVKLGNMSIGDHGIIGAYAQLHPTLTMEDNAMLLPLSKNYDGTCIPTGQLWGGNPAAPISISPLSRRFSRTRLRA